jgi:hypothetical protein
LEEVRLQEKFGNFRKAMRQELQSLDSPEMHEIRSVFETELYDLLRDGIVSPGIVHRLGGKALEVYVRYIFDDMGFEIEAREHDESIWDAVVRPHAELELQKPIVIEVKSGRSYFEIPVCHPGSNAKTVVVLCYLFRVAPERRFVLSLLPPPNQSMPPTL